MKKVRQKLRKFQESLGILFVPALLGVTFLFLLILGWSNVQPTSYSLELNQVAKETIRSPRTVVDKEQTEKNQQMAMDGVGDIYVFDQSREQQQIDKVNQFFQAIKTVATKASSEIFATDSTTTTSGEVSTRVATIQDRLTYFKKSLDSENKSIRDFALYIPDSVIIQLLSVSSDKLDAYESALETAIKEQMAKSITESNLQQAQEAAKKSLFNGGFTDNEREMLGQLLTNSIVVNNVVDKDATNSAKENAKQSVSPVRILQGQVIIQEGHIITQEDLRILELLGIDGNSSNYHQLYSYLLFLGILMISLLAFTFRFKLSASKKEWNTRVNELTVFSVVFTMGAILLKILLFLQNRGIDYIGIAFPIAGFIYIIYKLTTKFYFTIIAMVIYPILVWFMFSGDTISTEIALTTVFFSLAAWLGVIQDVYWKDLSWMKQLLLHIFIPVALMPPFIFFSNYELISTQSGWLIAFAAISGFLSYLIPIILMPYFTYLFEDSSVLLWAELSNPNQPLLKELITKAPGTYHHSLMVANISANCVEAIGGDSQLARVASYYHDIGKTEHPLFFIENLPAHMESPHKMIGPYESKEIIFDHVRKGVEILKQNQLPQSVIDICAEHHGTTLMKYFYAEALKENPDADEADFRYPGPKPQTKESAVINIVDSAEAATRAMKEPTLEKVQNLVHSIIMNRLEDEQFVECDITMRELAIIEKNIVASLNGTFHSRIEYPKLPKK
mgnify:FL=1